MDLRDLDAELQREQLHDAAQDGDLERVNDLLQRKYPVNRFDSIGHTPLQRAASAGHLHIVDRLIEAGANVNAHDERWIGNTPLSEHIEECSYDMAKRLIDAGADPTIRGWCGLNALYRAADRTDADAAKVQHLLREAAKRMGKPH